MKAMLNTPIKAFTKPVTDQQITNASSPGVEPSDSLPEADIAGQFTRLMAKGSCFSINQPGIFFFNFGKGP